jgi:coenzyme F420-0:L-glutamate ligase / coenzyme F420-1:gamma-L-glutamate ligase
MKLHAVTRFPLISPGDDLAQVIINSIGKGAITVCDGDIFVLAQKIVSKAEGRYAVLDDVQPSSKAIELAGIVKKDPRLVELILQESDEVLRFAPGVLIVAHRLGYIMANAGIDSSNLPINPDGKERVLLLPENPDKSCRNFRATIENHYQRRIGVIISDSVGRAWRNGSVGLALGVAGPPAVWNRVGEKDLFNRSLRVTHIALGDQIASAAALVMGEGDEGQPLVIVNGLHWEPATSDGKALLRPKTEDLFR